MYMYLTNKSGKVKMSARMKNCKSLTFPHEGENLRPKFPSDHPSFDQQLRRIHEMIKSDADDVHPSYSDIKVK